jgi:hypothetical protein
LVAHIAAPRSLQAPRGSTVFAGTFTQRPREVENAQYMHEPVQAVSQHTPSTQLPSSQSAADLQAWPMGRLPQLPFEHVLLGEQSALVAQLSLHWLPAHRYGAHATGAPAMQLPAPSQTLSPIWLPAEQVPGLQTVPPTYLAQPPCPLQNPLCPQLATLSLVHWLCASGAPLGTGLHWPILSVWLQVTQAPLQARLQQTPSAQNPELHSVAPVHAAPSGFLPQEPATQLRWSQSSAVLQEL